MPTALSKTCFTADAHSRAVFTSSKTNASAGDEPSSMKNPGRSGAPSSSEMFCTEPTIQAMIGFPYAIENVRRAYYADISRTAGAGAASLPALIADDTGAPDKIRTCDLCLRRAALYPAELRAR